MIYLTLRKRNRGNGDEIFRRDRRWSEFLTRGNRPPGRYEVGWNGDNDRGDRVASGVYFYQLTTSGFLQTRKMVLLK